MSEGERKTKERTTRDKVRFVGETLFIDMVVVYQEKRGAWGGERGGMGITIRAY